MKIFRENFFVENKFFILKNGGKVTKNTSVIFKCQYFDNKLITRKTVRHIHSLPLEVSGIRSRTLVAHSYIRVDLLPFTLKMTENTQFLMIFMIKTTGGVNIPPGISISIRDNGTSRVDIETPYHAD